MSLFKDAAYKILSDVNGPLHVKEITKRALASKGLESVGKTPVATMNSLLITDINALGVQSRFTKTAPATFDLNRELEISPDDSAGIEKRMDAEKVWEINQLISSKQKGDIVEARIAELVTLFGAKVLSCFRPYSDDDGVDLAVREKGGTKTLYIQVKSRWQKKGKRTIADVKRSTLHDKNAMAVVVCVYDVEEADIADYLWFIPAPEFVRLGTPIMKKLQTKSVEYLRLTATNDPEGSEVLSGYLVHKKDLANKIIEHMDRNS